MCPDRFGKVLWHNDFSIILKKKIEAEVFQWLSRCVLSNSIDSRADFSCPIFQLYILQKGRGSYIEFR